MASYFPMVKNTAQRIVFPILDADGDPVTGAAGDTPDSEYSLDGGGFGDITDEIHEIATNSGVYYLDLLTGETNGDVVAIQIKTATADTKTTVLVFYTSAQSLDTIDTNIDDIETEVADIHNTDLPAVKAETALIVEDTNEIQGKLPATKFMGSSDGADDDGTLNAITAAGPTLAQMNTAHGLLATETKQDIISTNTEQIRYGDMIYFEEGGAAGEDYPIGTPTNPSGVIADVIAICITTNIKKIHVHGALTLGDTMEHYAFFGERHETITDTVNLNGQDVDGSYFEGLTITGTQGGTAFINIKDCVVYALVDFRGMITNSAFYTSTSQLPDASFADWDSCYSISGAVTLTVQAPTRASIKDWYGNLILTAQDGGVMLVRGFTGTLEIDAMTSGALTIYANGADITINEDCTGGTINLYGNAQVTEGSGGVTINNYLSDTKIDNIETDTDALTGLFPAAQKG